jgi:hypothetical protein
MHQLDRFESGEIREIFHDEAVSLTLGLNPCVRFQTNVAVDAVEKLPGVGQVARIHILAL